MSKQESTRRHHLIIGLLRRKPSTFAEINDYLKQKSTLEERKYEINIRTFQRDVKEIASNYNIEIKCNRSDLSYQIVIDENDIHTERLIETYDMLNALNVHKNLSQHLILENRKPLGTENMHGILHAIKTHHQISFIHESYWNSDTGKVARTICPLVIKEAQNRWYIIGKDTSDNQIKTFGLDRITDFEILKERFKYPTNYNPEIAFKDSFGIVSSNGENPQKIILSFTKEQGKYVKSLPLHHSQKELLSNENEYQIQLYLHPTYDFEMELLSLGSKVKVLEPESLKNSIMQKIKEALVRYV